MSFADFIQEPESRIESEVVDPVGDFVSRIRARREIEELSEFEILGSALEQVEYKLLTIEQALEACDRLELEF